MLLNLLSCHSIPTHIIIFLSGPEVEARISAFRASRGPVLFGGRLKSETDLKLALPDNLGAHLDADAARIAGTAS